MNTKCLPSLIGLFLVALLAACDDGQTTKPVAESMLAMPAVAEASIPTSPLAATPLPPMLTPLPPTLAPQPVASLSDKELAATIDGYLAQQARDGYLSGAVLIARGDDIILEEGYGLANRDWKIPNMADTRFYIAALTKPVTALAIMLLQEQGKLNVTDAVCDYLDECPATWKPMIIRQLLNHTAGLDDTIGTSQIDIDPAGSDLVPLTDTVKLIAGQRMLFAPGNGWSYSHNGYVLLGAVIERVSGQSYESFMNDNIFGPLGMESTGFTVEQDDLAQGYARKGDNDPVEHVRVRAFYPAAGIQSTVGDLFVFSRALVHNQLVSEELLAQMLAPLTDSTFLKGEHYGYGWFAGEFEGHAFIEHPGLYEGYAARMVIFPDDDVTAIVLSNQESTRVWAIADYVAKAAVKSE